MSLTQLLILFILWRCNLSLLKKTSGFSLLEVLIALVILSISLLALAGLMITTTGNNSLGGHLTEAATFAQDRLEQLRLIPWQNITSGGDQIAGSSGINYIRNWTVVTNGNARTVTMRINWSDRNNHSISLASVISQ